MTASGGRSPVTALSRLMAAVTRAGRHRSALHIPVIGEHTRRSA